jgi:predicted metal-binding protein
VTKKLIRKISELAKSHGFDDSSWIDPGEIVTGQWVRTKCAFGCSSFGRKACCPPEIPSVGECRSFFDEYERGLFFHLSKKLDDPQSRAAWSREANEKALAWERDVFLLGFPKAFLFLPAPCSICNPCKSRKSECRNPSLARPTLEAYAVDVFSTARKFGYPIQVLKSYQEEMNRYGLLLVA